MKIIICGCGKIGSTLLSALVAEGHDLVALDDDPAALAEVTNIRDEDVRSPDAGVFQRFAVRAVSAHSDHVVDVGDLRKGCRVVVERREVVSFDY